MFWSLLLVFLIDNLFFPKTPFRRSFFLFPIFWNLNLTETKIEAKSWVPGTQLFASIFVSVIIPTMETLGKLFGSTAKVKIMKLFLSNEQTSFDNADISKRAKVTPLALKKELLALSKSGLIKKRIFYKDFQVKTKKTKTKPAETKVVKKKVNGWILNDKFPYLVPLHNLLVNMTSFTNSSILKKLSSSGKLKFVLLAGAFIQDDESRVDILIVGDNLKTPNIERAISVLESEIGKELSYVVLKTEDFIYRVNVYDKLVRDILDHPHQKIINKLGI